jgi:hypothetical protein
MDKQVQLLGYLTNGVIYKCTNLNVTLNGGAGVGGIVRKNIWNITCAILSK